MPFQKGNQLWKEGVEARQENKKKLECFLYIMATGGIERYGDMMDKLQRGEKLTEGEQEYMNRVEGWREFLLPKLARTDNTTTIKGGISLLGLHGQVDGTEQAEA